MVGGTVLQCVLVEKLSARRPRLARWVGISMAAMPAVIAVRNIQLARR
jgi:hypothetical protein